MEDRRRSNAVLVDFFFDLQQFVRPKTFAEIGAFDAGFSRRAKANFPHANVIAFEANPHNYAHHSANFDFAAVGIDYRHLAVSDRLGTITFQLQARRNGAMAPTVKGDDSLLKRAAAGVEYEEVSVATTTVDSFFSDAEYATDDFSFWIDVEGASELVFKGAERTLPRVHSIFIEVEEKPYWGGQWLFRDVAEHLYARGFKAVARDFENAHQFNVVFVHERVAAHYLFGDRMVVYHNLLARR